MPAVAPVTTAVLPWRSRSEGNKVTLGCGKFIFPIFGCWKVIHSGRGKLYGFEWERNNAQTDRENDLIYLIISLVAA
jgi:hypothetical protein